MSHTILDAIGNTPLVRLQKLAPRGGAAVYVKLEYFNPTGSYKDRMALAIVEEAEKSGRLKQGMSLIECTGGSTGTSLAFVCTVKGYPFKAVSSDAFAAEKLQSMRLFGAELEIVPSVGGKITPDLIPRMIDRVKEITAGSQTYWTQQFENKDAFVGYANIAKETLRQLDRRIDVFCAAVGTAGMFTGVARTLKTADPGTKVIALEPASAPLLSKGIKGSHKVEGVGVGFIPPLLDSSLYDTVMAVEEAEARKMAKLLATEEGIFAGISSGLNIAAAIGIAKGLSPGQTVFTIAVDSGMKYMSGGLFD